MKSKPLTCHLIASSVLLLSLSATAQSDPATLPNLALQVAAKVTAAIEQADGKTYIAGRFTLVNGTKRDFIARLNPNGSVDQTWTSDRPGLLYVGETHDLGLLADRLIMATDTGIYSLSLTNSSYEQLAQGYYDYIYALASDGENVYFGGERAYSGEGGIFGRLIVTNGGPAQFAGGGAVYSVLLDGTNLYIGGSFLLGRISTRPFGEFGAGWSVSGKVLALARAGNWLYVGGEFTSCGGYPLTNLARVSLTSGVVDANWNPGPNGIVESMLSDGDAVFVAGAFTSIGGLDRTNLARIDTGAAADPQWKANPTVPLPPVGYPQFSPQYVDFGTQPFVNFGRNWRLAPSGAGVLVAGVFTRIGGNDNQQSVARLNRVTGEADRSFSAQAGNPGWVSAMAKQADGKLVLAGLFTSVGGIAREFLARLNLDFSVDTSWDPRPDFAVFSVSASNKFVFVEGAFTSIGGANRKRRAKLSVFGRGLADTNYPGSDFAARPYTWRDIFLGPVETGPYGNPTMPGEGGTNVFTAFAKESQGNDESITIARISSAPTSATNHVWYATNFPDRFDRAAPVRLSLLGHRSGAMLGGTISQVGGGSRVGLAQLAVAEAPVLIKQSSTNLVILRNANNGPEVTHFQITNITGGLLFQSNGAARVEVGQFITAEPVETSLVFMATNGAGSVTAVSSVNDTVTGAGDTSTTLNLGATNGPGFSFSSANYVISEGSRSVRITVRKWGDGPASVNYSTTEGTALIYDYGSDTGDYVPSSDTLDFLAGETNKSFNIFINNDQLFTGDKTFWIGLTNPTAGGRLAFPAAAAITIVEDDIFGVPGSVTNYRSPDVISPLALGTLQVIVDPPNGQWRLAGEFAWRNAGDPATNLVPDIYTVEFKALPEYYPPENATVIVTNGLLSRITKNYTARSDLQRGELTVLLYPPEVTNNEDVNQRGRWRVQGQTNWYDSGETVGGLLPGGHIVTFKGEVPFFQPPRDHAVTVFPRVNILLNESYLPLIGTGSNATPHALDFGDVTNSSLPYQYCGQLETDVGLSSGVVVKERVVLTAAHALFNDNTLEWVTQARWFFQKHLPDHLPTPQVSRGWVVLSGYSAQRTNDLTDPINPVSPGYSTAESQRLDVAALYFVETVYGANRPGRGGHSGFLASDAGAYNEHLLTNVNKLLVGYPLRPDAETNWGRMYATAPADLHFTSINPRVFKTTDFLSYPGSSGGPLCVQLTNGPYYPAAIYLGGQAQSLVRVIDSQVVDLINRAEDAGSGGGNFTGGGVINFRSGPGVNASHPGSLKVLLGPPSAVRLGGAWRISPTNYADLRAYTNYITSSSYTLETASNNFTIEVKSLPGFVVSSNAPVEIVPDATVMVVVRYSVERPHLTFDRTAGLGVVSEAVGTRYRIETVSQLGGVWSPLTTNTLLSGTIVIPGTAPTAKTNRFYRAVWLPE